MKCCLFQQAWLADELCVKPMRFGSKSWVETWMNTEQLPFVFFATQKLSNLAQVLLFIVVVTDFPHHKRFHICRILQMQIFVLLPFILVSNEENWRREIFYIVHWKRNPYQYRRKIDKMAVSPHWRVMLNSTLTAPGLFQFKQHHHHCREQHQNKISGGSISSKYQVHLFLSLPIFSRL